MNCGDCILLRAALRNRRSRLLFANYIRAFRAFSRSKNLTADMHTARRKKRSFTGNSARNLKSFFGDVFSQDKASKPPLYMHTARRKKRSFTGNSARTSNHFSVMFFRKTRLLSRRCICIPQGARNEVLRETQPRTSNHFSAMFFRKTRKISDGVLSVLRAKFDAVFGKFSPNLSSFFGDVFSQDKASKPPLYIHTARRKKRSIAEKQPEKSDFHNVGFLFLCHIVNFFNVFVGYLLNFVLTVVELVFGYSFIFVELF